MLKLKIIAANIQNLTDARYFAAWGIDYMGFSIDSFLSGNTDIEKTKEIINWIEGPTIVAQTEMTSMDENTIDFISGIGFQGTITPSTNHSSISNFANIFGLSTFQIENQEPILIVKVDSIPNTIDPSFISNNQVYLDYADLTVDQIDDIIQMGFSGILLRGGLEEKIGFKSYDDLDSILEYLEE